MVGGLAVVLWLSCMLLVNQCGFCSRATERKNVLFVVSDDLRPSLGCYGAEKLITPNLDRLASRSVVFETVAAQLAVCAPSRTSFLTSRRPDTTLLFSNKGAKYWRDNAGNFTTLPQHFKEAGYTAISIGKIFHPGGASNFTYDYPYSWSKKPYHPSTEKYKNAQVCPNADGSLHTNIVCPVHVSQQPEGTLPDIQSTEYAIETLRNLSYNRADGMETPFFLAVGYHKPHIPLKFPKSFLELYPLNDIPIAPFPNLPRNLPTVAYEPWTDLRWRDDIAALNLSFPYQPIPDLYARRIRQSYFAATSFVDSLLGQLLLALENFGFADNTIVVFLGDHGWALGDNQEWSKFSNFRVATNVPLIVRVPGVTDEGATSEALVELVDLLPTLAELCALQKPEICPQNSSGVKLCTEGLSFAPLLENLSQPWKKAIFSQYPRPSDTPQNDSSQPLPEDIKFMGYSMQTTECRYTEWIEFDPHSNKGRWDNVHARELYLHKEENTNVAALPEYSQLVTELSGQLRRGWRSALPSSKQVGIHENGLF